MKYTKVSRILVRLNRQPHLLDQGSNDFVECENVVRLHTEHVAHGVLECRLVNGIIEKFFARLKQVTIKKFSSCHDIVGYGCPVWHCLNAQIHGHMMGR